MRKIFVAVSATLVEYSKGQTEIFKNRRRRSCWGMGTPNSSPLLGRGKIYGFHRSQFFTQPAQWFRAFRTFHTLASAFIRANLLYAVQKGIENCHADALSQLWTDAEAVNATVEFDISTFGAREAVSINYGNSEFEPDDQLLISQVAGSGEMTDCHIDLATLVREMLHNPFCRQIRERLNGARVLPFQISEDEIL